MRPIAAAGTHSGAVSSKKGEAAADRPRAALRRPRALCTPHAARAARACALGAAVSSSASRGGSLVDGAALPALPVLRRLRRRASPRVRRLLQACSRWQRAGRSQRSSDFPRSFVVRSFPGKAGCQLGEKLDVFFLGGSVWGRGAMAPVPRPRGVYACTHVCTHLRAYHCTPSLGWGTYCGL